MPYGLLRFIHAGDFHLERTPHGLAEIPVALRKLLVECPYLAAERVFESAISEQVDFVVLAGDVIDPHVAGPHATLFLAEQFNKLRARRIPVYWAGGQADVIDQDWTVIDWPDNVHLFSAERVEAFTVERDGRPLARIVGRSTDVQARVPADGLPADRDGLFTVGVAHCGSEGDPPTDFGVDYWALGGRHAAWSVPGTHGTAHFAGSPQGRCPDETGPHGCALVQVETDGRVRTNFQPTDVLRFLDERLDLPDHAGLDHLEAEVQARVGALSAEHSGCALLVRWLIDGPPRLRAQLRHGATSAELLDRMRREQCERHPPVWSLTLDTEGIRTMPTLGHDQDNMLGDFLRALRRQADGDSPLDLSGYLESAAMEPALQSMSNLADPALRTHVLLRAASLGIDLLTAEGTSCT